MGVSLIHDSVLIDQDRMIDHDSVLIDQDRMIDQVFRAIDHDSVLIDQVFRVTDLGLTSDEVT